MRKARSTANEVIMPSERSLSVRASRIPATRSESADVSTVRVMRVLPACYWLVVLVHVFQAPRHPRRAQPYQPAHRAQPGLQTPMIGFDGVVRMPLGDVARALDRPRIREKPDRCSGRYHRTATMITSGGKRKPAKLDLGAGTRARQRRIRPACRSRRSADATVPGHGLHRAGPGGMTMRDRGRLAASCTRKRLSHQYNP
jgi:hypothetical protein